MNACYVGTKEKTGMVSTELQPGDVIVTSRFLYRHYGIYAGNGKVIHYAAADGDFGSDVKVRESGLEHFAFDEEYGILQFREKNGRKKLFSPEETLCRARSRLGEESYNLIFNNCEHFVLWCKCGINKSTQVEKAACAIALLGAAFIAGHFVKKSIEEG